jgi:hypothetical protein
MSKIQQQLKQESKNRLAALNNEFSELKKVQQTLENFALEGLAVESMGVFFLVFGAIFATASTELAWLITWLSRCV